MEDNVCLAFKTTYRLSFCFKEEEDGVCMRVRRDWLTLRETKTER